MQHLHFYKAHINVEIAAEQTDTGYKTFHQGKVFFGHTLKKKKRLIVHFHNSLTTKSSHFFVYKVTVGRPCSAAQKDVYTALRVC